MKLTPAERQVWDRILVAGSISGVEALAMFSISDLAGRICAIRRELKRVGSAFEIKSVRHIDPSSKRPYSRYTRVLKPFNPFSPIPSHRELVPYAAPATA